MRSIFTCLILLLPFALIAQTENYPLDSASVVHAGVPKGQVLRFTFKTSKIYPGTTREYRVYIPAQYDPAKPACVFVDQDAVQFNAPTVFDNLINSKQMPVTIGVFVQPGRVLAANDSTSLDRFNRSYEYDGLGDAYARFILDEILPDVEKHKTADGKPIVLSKAAIDRAIGGTSSGAVCAFTAAWERPDAFSKVFSGIGTYVSLRGADRYPGLIRKYEPKPLRIFLQDGSNDHNTYGGDWFYANQMMERALKFAGYDVNHVYGQGDHNSKMATAYFAEAMRWLWRDYPAPIIPGPTKNPFLSDILVPGEGWTIVSKGYGQIVGLSVSNEGSVNFFDKKNIARSNGGKVTNPFGSAILNANDALNLNDRTYLNIGNIATGTGKTVLVESATKQITVDNGLNYPFGLAATPDHSQLYVTETNSHWVWIYNIQPDGTLTNKQRFGWLNVPDTAENAQAKGIKCDRDGRVYVATNMGIQVLDQIGRVNCILPLPPDAGAPVQLCFGGKDFDELYVACTNKIYRRKLKIKGMNDFDKPVKPAKPKL